MEDGTFFKVFGDSPAGWLYIRFVSHGMIHMVMRCYNSQNKLCHIASFDALVCALVHRFLSGAVEVVVENDNDQNSVCLSRRTSFIDLCLTQAENLANRH